MGVVEGTSNNYTRLTMNYVYCIALVMSSVVVVVVVTMNVTVVVVVITTIYAVTEIEKVDLYYRPLPAIGGGVLGMPGGGRGLCCVIAALFHVKQ